MNCNTILNQFKMQKIIWMTVALISRSIVAGVDAKPRPIFSPDDICIGAGNRCYCSNDTANLTAECCVTTNSGSVNCERCDIDTKTGDYVNCSITETKPLDNSKTHGNPPTSGALGSQPQNPGNVMTFNPPNNAKTFVNSNNSSK